ncbi:MAG: PepSY domain-containing protein [Gammaproteobacteria bacterium]|nr:PepSY domain-containing protein [Gammaproteobacteria bacterium]
MHKHLWTWHRRIGALLAFVVIILSVSGIALNHTEQFRLDQRHVQADWVLDWYGIKVPEQAQAVTVNQTRIALLGDHLYAGDKFIGAPYSELLGARWNGQVIAVVAGAEMLLLTADLELVEKITAADGLPAGIEALGGNDQRLLVRTPEGIWQADEQLLGWTQLAVETPAQWSAGQPMSGKQIDALRQDYRGRILTWERIFLDVHSGRFLGAAGPILADLVALMLLGLAGSGLWMWSRRVR